MQSKTPSRSIFQRIDQAIWTIVSWFFAAIFGFLLLMLCVGLAVMLVGCANKDIVLADPDAPLFVSDTSFGQYRVSAWDDDQKQLIDLGWRPIESLKGRTVSSFDWESYAQDR